MQIPLHLIHSICKPVVVRMKPKRFIRKTVRWQNIKKGDVFSKREEIATLQELEIGQVRGAIGTIPWNVLDCDLSRRNRAFRVPLC
jgi:hypothetical protein